MDHFIHVAHLCKLSSRGYFLLANPSEYPPGMLIREGKNQQRASPTGAQSSGVHHAALQLHRSRPEHSAHAPHIWPENWCWPQEQAGRVLPLRSAERTEEKGGLESTFPRSATALFLPVVMEK